MILLFYLTLQLSLPSSCFLTLIITLDWCASRAIDRSDRIYSEFTVRIWSKKYLLMDIFLACSKLLFNHPEKFGSVARTSVIYVAMSALWLILNVICVLFERMWAVRSMRFRYRQRVPYSTPHSSLSLFHSLDTNTTISFLFLSFSFRVASVKLNPRQIQIRMITNVSLRIHVAINKRTISITRQTQLEGTKC